MLSKTGNSHSKLCRTLTYYLKPSVLSALKQAEETHTGRQGPSCPWESCWHLGSFLALWIWRVEARVGRGYNQDRECHCRERGG